jgi:D-arabinitol dehydrogenase (NADP+)
LVAEGLLHHKPRLGNRPRGFTVREVPTPVAGPGEIRVPVIQTGVRGTDLHLHGSQLVAAHPLTPGHEAVGVVDQLGDGSPTSPLSQQVTITPNTS